MGGEREGEREGGREGEGGKERKSVKDDIETLSYLKSVCFGSRPAMNI